jgi:hypothetical protein
MNFGPAKNVNPNSNMSSFVNISPKKEELPKTQPNQNFMNVPIDIAKKLQQGNDSFIVGYNPATLPVEQPSKI